MNGSALAALALLPLITGPGPQDTERSIVAQLCGGGTITISIGGDEPIPPAPCEAKGCHAGPCRDRSDRAAKPLRR